MDKNGLSDPYVKLFLQPGSKLVSKLLKSTLYSTLTMLQNFLMQQKFRTKTILKNLNPKFQETFTFAGIFEEALKKKKLW